MTENVFIAINDEALHAKSKVYIGRALSRKADGDLDEYQLWASLALELLGKAALAREHPSLVVDPTHWQSMFVAAGIKITTDVKTITAKTLFQRLAHLVPRFDTKIQNFCGEIAERRNAELHSADLPFRTMRLDAWEARYWHACDTILNHMRSSLEQWLGATDAQAPRQLLNEAGEALKAAVKLRVEAAKEGFAGLKKAERESLIAEAELRQPAQQAGLFQGSYDKIWTDTCPSCQSRAFMTGEQTGEDISEERDLYAIWEIVDRQAVGRTGETRLGRLTALVGAGYFFVWTVFGMAAFPLGAALAAIEMQQPALASAVPIAVAVVVLIAGVVQFTAWKAHHLAWCREAPGSGSPLPADAGTAWRHGVRLGLHCVHCCANLMAILLVIGVMDLRAMMIVAAAIAIERLTGERAARAVGAVVIGGGLFMIAQATGPG